MSMASMLDDVVAGRTPRMPYEETLRLPRAEGWEPGRVWCSWQVDPDVMQPWGGVFGGYLALLADQFAGLATLSVLDEGEQFATADIKVSPMRAIKGGVVKVEARVLRRARRTIHTEVDFTLEDGTLAARGAAIQTVIPTP